MKSADARLSQRVDLWLLACLEALVEEGSVTRAAARLRTTQPSMSHALARLREILGDPILLKTAQGHAATARAQALARDTVVQRRAIESALVRSQPFDLQACQRRMVIALTDHPALFAIPQLFDRAAREAPLLEIEARLPDHTRIRQWLETGECDLAVGYFPDLPADLRTSLLFEDSVSVVTRREGDAAPPELERDDYLQLRHLVVSGPFAPLTTLETVLDRTLAADGQRRIVGGTVPSISLAYFVVAASSLALTMPTLLSRRFATTLPLDLRPLPLPGLRVQILMAWHERVHLDPAHQWVRTTLRETFDALGMN